MTGNWLGVIGPPQFRQGTRQVGQRLKSEDLELPKNATYLLRRRRQQQRMPDEGGLWIPNQNMDTESSERGRATNCEVDGGYTTGGRSFAVEGARKVERTMEDAISESWAKGQAMRDMHIANSI